VVASPSYFARRGVPNNPADLQAHDAIIYRQAAGGHEWLFRRGTSEVSIRLQARLTLSAAEGVREAVLTGQEFGIASRWMFAPELASGEVVPVLEDWSLPPMGSMGDLSFRLSDKGPSLCEVVSDYYWRGRCKGLSAWTDSEVNSLFSRRMSVLSILAE